MTDEPLAKTRFTDIELFKRGKVRDVYDLADKLLVVSTDRISCFDVVDVDEVEVAVLNDVLLMEVVELDVDVGTELV